MPAASAGRLSPAASSALGRRASLRARTRKERERAQLGIFVLSMVGVALVFLVPPFIGAPVESLALGMFGERAAGFAMGAAIISVWSVSAAVLYRQFRKSLLHANRRLAICPACDADLRGAPADGDGLTPCPNCHAKWTLPGTP